VVIAGAAGLGLYLTSHDGTGDSGQVGLNTSSAGASPRLTVGDVSGSGTAARAATGGSTGSAAAGAPPAAAGKLASAMLAPATLGAEWSNRTAAKPTEKAFCKAPLGFSGGERGSVLLVRSSPTAVAIQQDAFRGTKGQAATSLAAVRTSAGTCTTWTDVENGTGVTYTFTPIANAATIGDASAEYRVQRVSGSVTVYVVQVFVVQKDVLSILAYATVTPTTDADVAAAESWAAKGAERLAAAP
jgi:hypothetical protein